MSAYNLANFLCRLALPTGVKHWAMTTLPDKLIKIGAKMAHRARPVTFPLTEVALPHGRYEIVVSDAATGLAGKAAVEVKP